MVQAKLLTKDYFHLSMRLTGELLRICGVFPFSFDSSRCGRQARETI